MIFSLFLLKKSDIYFDLFKFCMLSVASDDAATSSATVTTEEKVADMADFLSELLYMPHKAVSASGGTT